MDTALHRAVEIVGGQTELARRCGVSQQRVWHWLHKSGRVAPECVIAVEKATDGQVKRHELRPDLYPEAA